MRSSHFSRDTLEFIHLLFSNDVRYVIVGGEAVIYYGHIRLTGDVDFFYDREEINAANLFKALQDFWGNAIPGDITKNDLMEKGVIIQFGMPPNRIDLINVIDGVSFAEVWEGKTIEKLPIKRKYIPLYYIGLDQLRKNKAASGRNKDLDDLQYLNQS